jgi:hypothetical protein
MKMTTTLEYALLAGDAYFSTRAEINRFPIPEGWTEDTDERRADVQTGFEARTFQKGNEIVISFSGTDPDNSNPFTSPDGTTNKALNDGRWTEQLLQAATYYLDIKAANSNATITFTGKRGQARINESPRR